MEAELASAVGAALGSKVESAKPVSGGSINRAHAVRLADGRDIFVKSNAGADARMFACEARGLAWLREARALRVPDVLAVSERFLALELLEPGAKVRDFDVRLGRGLAALHQAGAPSFGLDHDNFIGDLPQANSPSPSWAKFYATRRIEPLVRRAVDSGSAPPGLAKSAERVLAKLPELLGPAEPAARLHGDLWGGNLHVAPNGTPCLIDPAIYGGHREVDLAMMRLFGGFSERVFSAYDEAWPLAAGHAERVPLYQLYPLLVHANLFGGNYVASAERVLARYA